MKHQYTCAFPGALSQNVCCEKSPSSSLPVLKTLPHVNARFKKKSQQEVNLNQFSPSRFSNEQTQILSFADAKSTVCFSLEFDKQLFKVLVWHLGTVLVIY